MVEQIKPRRPRRILSPSARGRKGGKIGGLAKVPKGWAKRPRAEVVANAKKAAQKSAEVRRAKKEGQSDATENGES